MYLFFLVLTKIKFCTAFFIKDIQWVSLVQGRKKQMLLLLEVKKNSCWQSLSIKFSRHKGSLTRDFRLLLCISFSPAPEYPVRKHRKRQFFSGSFERQHMFRSFRKKLLLPRWLVLNSFHNQVIVNWAKTCLFYHLHVLFITIIDS